MTPEHPLERFERTMGCTAAELIGWLPRSLPGAELTIGSSDAWAEFERGSLRLTWKQGPPRRIALLEIPSLQVAFVFEGMPPHERRAVLRHFDLATHRGGG